MGLFTTKNLDAIVEEAEASTECHLKRCLTWVDLLALGIGAIVGAGIFAVTGTASAGSEGHLGAGPALVISFIITAIACGFTVLCYAEFATLIPISGSVYTYAYATLGELVAWIIGWDLILEYAVGNVAVAISWAGYFTQFLKGFGIDLPFWLTLNYSEATNTVFSNGMSAVAQAPHLGGIPIIFNLPAVLIVTIITIILVIGIKESAGFNNFIVVVKLLVLGLFILIGAFYVKPQNWHPFCPNGWAGIQTGAALVFFAYIGFDAITTAAEETKDPKRDLPIGMIGSLGICTVIYIIVSLVLTGMVHWKELGVPDPLAYAFSSIGVNWAAALISVGALLSTTSVLLVFQLGQPRIFFSMARDGLLPRVFTKVHSKFRTPYVTTILTGAVVAMFAAFSDINKVVELTNIGTLFAFLLVCAGVIILRYKNPQLKRSFSYPGPTFLVPSLGIITCVYLMLGLPLITWIRFVLWLFSGLLIYFLYSHKNSKLQIKLNK